MSQVSQANSGYLQVALIVKVLSNILFKTYRLCHQIAKVVKNSSMFERINKTSICSIVFLDIIDFTKKTDAEQIDAKNKFNNLINHALKDIAQNDRIILDTGDGVVIAYMGSPEDALFVALTIRDEVLNGNAHCLTPLFVRFGINLGPIRVVNDINGQPNIMGDGINVAQRIMSFAEPNQILASRSYYEITSHLTQEISQMFDYSGVKQDKHVRAHEVYSVRSPSDQKAAKKQPSIVKNNRQLARYLARLNKVDWKYVAPSLLILLVLFAALIALVKLVSAPIEPAIAIAQPSAAAKEIPAATPPASSKPSNDGLMPIEAVENLPLDAAKTANENGLAAKPQNSLQEATKATGKDAGTEALLIQEKTPEEKLAEELTKAKLAKKKAKQKAESETTPELVLAHTSVPKNQNAEVKPVGQHAKAAESAENDKTKEKLGWKTFINSLKRGKEHECSQAEILMHRCS